MRQDGDVLLLSCYELGHQPVNLASPLATLQAAGYRPAAIDTSLDALPESALRQARLVAISVPMHTALRLGEGIARRVRLINPRAHVTFFGLYAWLNSAYLFERRTISPSASPSESADCCTTDTAATGCCEEAPPESPSCSTCSPSDLISLPGSYQGALADSVIGGEFELPLLALTRWLESAGNEASRPPLVSFPGRPAQPALERVDFHLPVRASLPALDRYGGVWRDGIVLQAGYVEATRGCKHTCLHCPITPVYRGRFFAVPREIVLADIRQQVAAGARHITFGDPDFLNGPTHALKLARALHEEFPAVTFDATIKIEHILKHRDIFPELRELGCVFVVSAVESLSDTVLAHLRKGHTRADVVEALDIMASAGIPLRPSLVAFTPWTTLADYLALLRFVEERSLVDLVDPVHYAIRLLVPPGSALLDEPDAQSWIGDLDAELFSHRWTHPDPRMETLFQDVSRIVAESECESVSADVTFSQVKRAAEVSAGLPPSPALTLPPERPLPPRLTESWFCCAEPLANQLERVAY